MKKLFTLVALLAVFLGAKADWVEDYKIDYSTKAQFPFYVMGYVPEWVDGVMTDLGGNYKYVVMATEDQETKELKYSEETSDVIISLGDKDTQKYYKIYKGDGNTDVWHQYFIADGIPTEIDGAYTVKAMVRASKEVTININMGWGWGEGQKASASATIGTEWAEVEWSYTGIAGTSCNLVAQPNTDATIEWKSLIVGHNQKAKRPQVWQEWLNSDGQPFIMAEGAKNEKYMGDAETPWPAWAADADAAWRGHQTGEICAWGKTKGRNEGPVFDPTGENEGKTGFNPFPADIEVDPDNANNHVFVVHGAVADTEGDPSAWDNQFWIQSPQSWKEGTTIKIKFRYKASEAAKVATQIHKENPSNYLHWAAIGDVEFETTWKDFEKTVTFDGNMATGWSVAFNLNANNKNAVDFYFDDLCWQTMKLDEGYFIAGSNPDEGLAYDLDNAIQFVQDPESSKETDLFATVGEKNAYVSEVMLSTVRGNDSSFKSETLKLKGSVELNEDDESEWVEFEKSSLAKTKLPASGIWNVYLDLKYNSVQFVLVEGVKKEAGDIVTNNTAIVVHGKDREDLKDEWDGQNQVVKVREDADPLTNDKDDHGLGGEGHEGQTWDNQFFLKANRTLAKGEVTVLKFKYKSSVAAKTTTQCHGNPGGYMHWAAIGDVNFTTDWQNFEQDFTVPEQADGMQCLAFNMAEIKEACDYEITDVQWYLKDAVNENGKTWENLINATGTANFIVKEGAGTDPHEFVPGGTGIENVAAKSVKTSTAIYNLAGQRVSNGFKGLVIKDGKKFVK